MKFLCSNCKAKYQIADEKVVGKTMRMTCHRCKHEIVIRGDAPPGSRAVAPPPPAVPPPSALGAGFQRHVAAGGAPVAGAAGADDWHVAINDIPVGPMRRDEVGRKIALGAISPESLSWREGMDDWFPVRQIPELAALLAPAPPPALAPPPPVAGSAVPPMPPPPPAMSAPVYAPPQAPPQIPQPAMRAGIAPVGGRMGVAADPMEGLAPPPMLAPAPMPPSADTGASQVGPMPSAPQQRASWGPMFLAMCIGAFVMASGAVIGARMLGGGAAPAAPDAPVAEAAPTPALAPTPTPAPEQEVHVMELDLQEIEALEQAEKKSASRSGKSSGSSASTSSSSKKSSASAKRLTAEQKAMLARMGGGFDSSAGKLNSKIDRSGSGSSKPKGEGLTAQELSRVVLKGRKNLQRCYEVALRGAQSEDTVRMDVSITVAPSGNVSKVTTAGKGLPGMDKCITRTAKMWRFPRSGDTTQTKFPVVFQPGG